MHLSIFCCTHIVQDGLVAGAATSTESCIVSVYWWNPKCLLKKKQVSGRSFVYSSLTQRSHFLFCALRLFILSSFTFFCIWNVHVFHPSSPLYDHKLMIIYNIDATTLYYIILVL